MTFYSVVRRRKDIARRPKEQYEIVSFYDSQNHFRGEAIFPTKKAAEIYANDYRKRLEKRNQDSGGNNKLSLELKIVKDFK
jgi:hypothetical protein